MFAFEDRHGNVLEFEDVNDTLYVRAPTYKSRGNVELDRENALVIAQKLKEWAEKPSKPRVTISMKLPAIMLRHPEALGNWAANKLEVDGERFVSTLTAWIDRHNEEPLVLVEDGAWQFIGSPVPVRPVEYIRFSVSVSA